MKEAQMEIHKEEKRSHANILPPTLKLTAQNSLLVCSNVLLMQLFSPFFSQCDSLIPVWAIPPSPQFSILSFKTWHWVSASLLWYVELQTLRPLQTTSLSPFPLQISDGVSCLERLSALRWPSLSPCGFLDLDENIEGTQSGWMAPLDGLPEWKHERGFVELYHTKFGQTYPSRNGHYKLSNTCLGSNFLVSLLQSIDLSVLCLLGEKKNRFPGYPWRLVHPNTLHDITILP